MEVLHLISDTDRRGAQVFATQLHNALEERSIPGSVAALAAGRSGAVLDVPVLDSSWTGRRRALRRAAIVVAHGSTTLDAAAVTVPGRFVYRSIGDPRFWLSSAARRLKTGGLLRTAKTVVALYPDAAAALHSLARVPEARLRVIPNAVAEPGESASVDALSLASRHVLYVGAMSWEKQVDHLIRAVAMLRDVGLVCVGDGPDLETLQTLGRRALGRRFVAVGTVRDPTGYYRACDVLGLTSRTEGQPGCVLEASLNGIPTCAYRIGGVGDLILDGISGYLVPPDDVTAMAEALSAALDDATGLGRRAADHVRENNSLGTVADRWADLLTEIVTHP